MVVTKVGRDPFRGIGKFSSNGDKALGSQTDLVGEFEKPASWSSVGGVGVRGGSGTGVR